MAVLTGATFTIEVSDDDGATWEFVENAINWRGGGERQSNSYPRYHATSQLTLPGQPQYSYTFDMYYDPADDGQNMVRDAGEATTDDAAEIMIRITRGPAEGFRQVVRVSVADGDVPIDGPQIQNVTVTGTGDVLPYVAA